MGRLDPARIALLEALPGWDWELRREHNRSAEDGPTSPVDPGREDSDGSRVDHVALLRSFVAQHGRPPRVREVFEGVALGRWAAGARSRWRMGKMQPEEAKELEAVPGWTWAKQESMARTSGERYIVW